MITAEHNIETTYNLLCINGNKYFKRQLSALHTRRINSSTSNVVGMMADEFTLICLGNLNIGYSFGK